jgi:hypothetical protein
MGRQEGEEIHGRTMRRYGTGKAAGTADGVGFLAAIVGDGVLPLPATAASLVLAGQGPDLTSRSRSRRRRRSPAGLHLDP